MTESKMTETARKRAGDIGRVDDIERHIRFGFRTLETLGLFRISRFGFRVFFSITCDS